MRPTSPYELMVTLGQQYRRIRADRQREGSKGTTARRIEAQMAKVAERFERLVEHWVHDEQRRESWRDFFYHEADEPVDSLPTPPLFRGQNQAGALVEVHASSDGGHDVFVDGVHADHYDMPWQSHPDRFAPIIVGPWQCTETILAPADALAALDSFLSRPDSEPPWAWAPALYADGLIDGNFGLTPRGARRTSNESLAAVETGEVINYCVVLANAGRARIFTLQADALEPKTTFEPLTEVSDVVSGLARTTDSQQFSNSRPGLRREGPHGPRHAVDDRRQNHRRESQRRYIQRIVEAAAKVCGQFDSFRIVLVASPLMLTRLRPAIERRLNGSSHLVYGYPGDLNWQEAAAAHATLARAGLLPTRARRPPVRPMRTPNPWQGEG